MYEDKSILFSGENNNFYVDWIKNRRIKRV